MQRTRQPWCVLAALLGSAWLASCGGDPKKTETNTLTRQQLLDPATCKTCHAQHYDEWSASMHAYAAEDPVFLAMNARGQRETGGKLGDFCVRCHAPMALSEGATTDGLNLPELPSALKGVTCYFCHNAQSVEGTHNNPLTLSGGRMLRGAIANPVANPAHEGEYSPLLDRTRLESASACGACHDLVVPAALVGSDVHLERTFAEWQTTIFNAEGVDGQRCGTCHMSSQENVAIADFPGVPARTRHAHAMPGVDVALTPFPGVEQQKQQIEEFLDRSLRVEVCVGRDLPKLRVLLDNVGAGHDWPSGAAQDRRGWVEIVAYSGANKIFETGDVADDADITALEDSGAWVFRDRAFKADGKVAHMFWDVASVQPGLISGPLTLEPTSPDYFATHATRLFPNGSLLPGRPDRVTVRVRLRPIGVDVLNDLAASGDLSSAAQIVKDMPVFTLSPARKARPPWDPELTVEWSASSYSDAKYGFTDAIDNRPADCVRTALGRQQP